MFDFSKMRSNENINTCLHLFLYAFCTTLYCHFNSEFVKCEMNSCDNNWWFIIKSLNVCSKTYLKIILSQFTLKCTTRPRHPRPMANGTWQFLGLDLVNVNVYAKNYQSITYSSRVRANFICFKILTSAEPRPLRNDIWQYLLVLCLSVSMHMQNCIKIFHTVQEIGQVSFFFSLRIWTSAKPRPMTNVIWQSREQDLVNINVYAKFYQNIPYGWRVMGNFGKLIGDEHVSQTDLGRAHWAIIVHAPKVDLLCRWSFCTLCNQWTWLNSPRKYASDWSNENVTVVAFLFCTWHMKYREWLFVIQSVIPSFCP